MIDDPLPSDWRELQNGVCRLFNDIGLSAQTEVDLKTPRGRVNIDVYAIDERSVDKIKYLVECKNWSEAVPQTVVHALTTVMQETGANIGFIVSRVGLQSGASQYTQSTNISGLTYADLQKRYFPVWWRNYFCPRAASAADTLVEYVEPFNSRRFRHMDEFSAEQLAQYQRLHDLYADFAMVIRILDVHPIVPQPLGEPPESLDDFKQRLSSVFPHFGFTATTFRQLLDEICHKLDEGERSFHALFGKNIFAPD